MPLSGAQDDQPEDHIPILPPLRSRGDGRVQLACRDLAEFGGHALALGLDPKTQMIAEVEIVMRLRLRVYARGRIEV